MKVRFQEDPGAAEPALTLTARTLTPELESLMARLAGLRLDPIPAFRGEEGVLLEQGDILRFYADGKGVCVQSDRGLFTVRRRLYELEEQLDPHAFVRISHSEIVNLKRVTALDLSLTGTIRMTLGERVCTYVSRRYVKKIRQALDL